MTATTAYAIESAMAAALDKFYTAHPEVTGIALDTVRTFADERFRAACTPEIVADARFAEQAPAYAYELLLRESVTLAKSLTGR